MEIKETRILARASCNYNVGEVEMTVTNATSDELKEVQKQCIMEASKIAKSLTKLDEKSSNVECTTEVHRQPVQGQYRRPVNNGYQQHISSRGSFTPKMITEAQINYLYGLGYTGPVEGMTSKQAIDLIQNLKSQHQQQEFDNQSLDEFEHDIY